MTPRPTLANPVVADRFWRNRGGEAVVTRLLTHNGINLVDLRIWAVAEDGVLRPGPKGVALSVHRLAALAHAVNKALAKAIELELVDGAGGRS